MYLWRGERCHLFCSRCGKSPYLVLNMRKRSTKKSLVAAKKPRRQQPVRQQLSSGRCIDWPSSDEAAMETGISKANIFRACSGPGRTAGGSRWKTIRRVSQRHLYENSGIPSCELNVQTRMLPVRQWLSDSQYVDWPNRVEASRVTKTFLNAIGLVCRGRRKTAGGFCWEAISAVEPERLYGNCGIDKTELRAHGRGIPVRQWLVDGRYVDWHNISEAARVVNVDISAISCVCRGKSKTAGGFRWGKISQVDPEHLYKNCGIAINKIKAQVRPVASKLNFP